MDPLLSKRMADLNTRLLVLKEVLNIDEAAQYIGVSAHELLRIIELKELPFYTPYRKHIFFKRKEIDDWLTGKKA